MHWSFLKVCKLKEILYRLKQALKVWYARIDLWFTKQGSVRSTTNPNLYYTKKNNKLIIILLYIDNLLITWNFKKNIK